MCFLCVGVLVVGVVVVIGWYRGLVLSRFCFALEDGVRVREVAVRLCFCASCVVLCLAGLEDCAFESRRKRGKKDACMCLSSVLCCVVRVLHTPAMVDDDSKSR